MKRKRAVLSAILATILLLSLGTRAFAYRENLPRQAFERVIPHLDGDPDIPNPIAPSGDRPAAGIPEAVGEDDPLAVWRNAVLSCLRALGI
jgi:hypothetical protein